MEPRQRLLLRILLANAALALTIAPADLAFRGLTPNVIITGILVAVYAGGLALLRRGRVKLAGAMLVTGLISGMFLITAAMRGQFATAYWFAVVPLIASFVVGTGIGVLAGVTIAVGHLVFYFATGHSWTPPTASPSEIAFFTLLSGTLAVAFSSLFARGQERRRRPRGPVHAAARAAARGAGTAQRLK